MKTRKAYARIRDWVWFGFVYDNRKELVGLVRKSMSPAAQVLVVGLLSSGRSPEGRTLSFAKGLVRSVSFLA